MEHALPRRAAGIPRTWSLCMTSENHGTVGPAGCTFSHAPDKHERVLVVEVPAAAGAPVDQVNLQLVTSAGGQADVDRALRAAQAWVNEEYMCGRRMGKGEPAMSDRAETANTECIAAILALAAPVSAQAGHVAVPEGWKLVPTHPDQFMINAFITEYERPGGSESGCYRAMLAAAPVAPAAPAQAAPLPVQPAAVPAEPIECWSHNEEDFNAQSLGELIDTHELQPGATVWVGEAVHPEPSSLFSTDWLIENMGEAAYDIAGEHGGEDYPNVSDEQVAELEALVVGWITKCAPPSFWTVKNVRPYTLTAEDCSDQAPTSGERQEGGAA